MRWISMLRGIVGAVVFWTLLIPAARAELIAVEILGDNDYVPYSYEQDGEPKGIYVDILNRVFEEVRGFEVTIRMLPWKRGLALVARGDSFAIFPPYYFPEERPFLHPYSQPLLLEQVAIFCHEGVMDKPRTNWPADFYQLRIGNNQGFLTPGAAFFGAVNAGLIDLNEVTDTNTGLRMLLHGRIDCFVNDRRAILWELQSLRQSGSYQTQLGAVHEAASGDGHWAYIGYTNKQLDRYPFKNEFVRQVNAIIERMHETGEIDRIAEKRFSEPRQE